MDMRITIFDILRIEYSTQVGDFWPSSDSGANIMFSNHVFVLEISKFPNLVLKLVASFIPITRTQESFEITHPNLVEMLRMDYWRIDKIASYQEVSTSYVSNCFTRC
jgi:hypothetical protein